MALLETIRSAIRTKGETDIAALRGATLGRRKPLGGLPRLWVHIPTFTMDGQPGAVTERYTLTYPGFLEVAVPNSESRADTEAADLLYAVIVSWRSGIQLGLGSSGVVGSFLSSATPAYETNDAGVSFLVGYDLVWTVPMLETLQTPRSV